MTTPARIGTAERLGRAFGSGWRLCSGRAAHGELVGLQGSAGGGCHPALWAVKLAALGALFCAAFWLALVFLLGVAAAWMASNSVPDDERWTQPDEPRNGEAGFGLYSSSGQRIDPHDPNDPFNEYAHLVRQRTLPVTLLTPDPAL